MGATSACLAGPCLVSPFLKKKAHPVPSRKFHSPTVAQTGQHLESSIVKKHSPDPDSRCNFRTLGASDWAAVHGRFKTGSAQSAKQKLELWKVNNQEQHTVSMCSFRTLSASDWAALHDRFETGCRAKMSFSEEIAKEARRRGSSHALSEHEALGLCCVGSLCEVVSLKEYAKHYEAVRPVHLGLNTKGVRLVCHGPSHFTSSQQVSMRRIAVHHESVPLLIHSEEPAKVLCGDDVSIFLDRDQMPYGASHAYAQHIVELKLPYMEESQLWWYLKFVNKSMEDLEELSHRCPDSLHRCLAQDHGQKWLRVHEALDARWHVAEDVTASTALPPAPPTALAASTQVLEVAAAPAAPAAPNGLKLEGAEVPLDAAMTTATTTATTTTTPPPPPPPPPPTTMRAATPTQQLPKAMSDPGSSAAEFAKKVLKRDKWAMEPSMKASETDRQASRKTSLESIGSRATFLAALAKFQNLEHGSKDAPQTRTCSLSKATKPLKAVAAEGPMLNDGGPTSVKQSDAHPNQQQKIKVLVADRFAALVSEGLEPNAAAARAILEAAGRLKESEEPEGLQSPCNDSSKWGCASSAQSGCRKEKDTTVAVTA